MAELPRLNGIIKALEQGSVAFVGSAPADGAAGSRFVRVLEARPLVAAGVVSYSIFLWHEPLIRWLDEHDLTVAGRSGWLLNLLVAFTITVVASTLTYRLIEAPALRLKFRRPEAPAEPPTEEEKKRRPQPKPIPRPFPGATMQPPPEGAKG